MHNGVEDAAQTSTEIDAQVKQIKIDCRPTGQALRPAYTIDIRFFDIQGQASVRGVNVNCVKMTTEPESLRV